MAGRSPTCTSSATPRTSAGSTRRATCPRTNRSWSVPTPWQLSAPGRRARGAGLGVQGALPREQTLASHRGGCADGEAQAQEAQTALKAAQAQELELQMREQQEAEARAEAKAEAEARARAMARAQSQTQRLVAVREQAVDPGAGYPGAGARDW